MRPSRGLGDIAPEKMPRAKRKARRDDTDFDMYAKGGKIYKPAKGSALNYKRSRSKKGMVYPDLKMQAKR